MDANHLEAICRGLFGARTTQKTTAMGFCGGRFYAATQSSIVSQRAFTLVTTEISDSEPKKKGVILLKRTRKKFDIIDVRAQPSASASDVFAPEVMVSLDVLRAVDASSFPSVSSPAAAAASFSPGVSSPVAAAAAASFSPSVSSPAAAAAAASSSPSMSSHAAAASATVITNPPSGTGHHAEMLIVKYWIDNVMGMKGQESEAIKHRFKSHVGDLIIAADATCCFHCHLMLKDLNISHPDKVGPRTNTAWWNPLTDKVIANGDPAFREEEVPSSSVGSYGRVYTNVRQPLTSEELASGRKRRGVD